ncbi:MAG: SDR family oxidoreductase [Parahaliea sp.]
MMTQTRSIFVTGAAHGIGRATALHFHQQGWFVGVYDREPTGLQSLVEELGDRAISGSFDVSDRSAFSQSMAEFQQATNGRLDMMCNNAGISAGGYLDEIPPEELRKVVDVNFMGVINGMLEALPLLRQTAGSLCLNVSSGSAVFGVAGMAVYSATKAAVSTLTEAMSVEWRRYGIRVADVLPGIVRTNIWQDSKRYRNHKVASNHSHIVATGRGFNDNEAILSAQEMAEVIWRAYDSDKLHHFYPDYLRERAVDAVMNPEVMRDTQIKRQSK